MASNGLLNESFTEHVKYLRLKTYAKIILLGRLHHILDQGTALTLYKTLILPIYDYCDYEIYYSISSNDMEVLQNLQNCAFRTILRVERLTSTAYTHEILHMHTLAEHREKHVVIQMCRYVNNLPPEYCCNMFTTVQERHDVNTRSSANDDLVLPKMNLSLGQRNINFFGVKVWQKITMKIKCETTLENFKKPFSFNNLPISSYVHVRHSV